MDVSTKTTVDLSRDETFYLWSILHHRVNEAELTESERKFKSLMLTALDPIGELQREYETNGPR